MRGVGAWLLGVKAPRKKERSGMELWEAVLGNSRDYRRREGSLENAVFYINAIPSVYSPLTN